jgi:signal transduction histidine kinase
MTPRINNGNRLKNKPLVLVVDDTEENLDMLEYSLRQKPISIIRAANGRDCIAIARQKLPDIILLDIRMPEIDGFQTLKRLRDHPLTSDIPVIMLTAELRDPHSIEKGFRYGAEEYLTKPIDIEELYVRIRMLIRSKMMKEDLEKTKSNFMAMLIHDLRSPLVGVKSAVELMRGMEEGTVLNKAQLNVFKSAEVSVNQMLSLINNFLDLSKYSSKTIRLYQEPVPLHVLVEHSLQQVEFQFKQKQIALENRIGSDLPEAYIDAGKTQQVFLNILDNALKFTRRGGAVKICAQVDPAASAGTVKKRKYLRVSISDNGIGIRQNELNALFKPYQQASSAQTINEKGTGLGLSICKLIVEAQGGSISVESAPGKQTTFHFTLPVAQHN